MDPFDPTAPYADIREGVANVCADFPGPYWQELDRDRAYPKAFVDALIREGYLAAMIPEEYGGSGLPLTAAAVILEEIHRGLVARISLFRSRSMSREGRAKSSLAEMREIYEAIAAGDEKAARKASKKHVLNAKAAIEQALNTTN